MVKAIDVINEKEDFIKELDGVNKKLLEATINYKQVQAKLWLDTDFNEALNQSRPTVDQKKAYVTLNSLEEKQVKEHLQYTKEYLLKMIDLCDDKLMVCDE